MTIVAVDGLNTIII